MYRLMRNIHLGLGLGAFMMAMIFALSSLVIVYRPLLPKGMTETQSTVQLEAAAASTPRAIASQLMREHDLAGDLSQITEEGSVVQMRIFRPGEEVRVTFNRESREAVLTRKNWTFPEMMVQLHVNHGFWHDFMPSNLWSALSLLASIALLLLGASGIYLWFSLHKERVVGGLLLVFALAWGLSTLILTRLT